MTKIVHLTLKSNPPLIAFYKRIYEVTEADWPKDNDQILGNPYDFKWADELFRDQIISWLVHSADNRQTDYASRAMLRYLMFRFRVAQPRRNAKGMSSDFKTHRWVWATHTEVSRLTDMSEQTIARAVKELQRRELIHYVYDYSLNNVPHYRPSSDLFRLCRLVTACWDKHFLEAVSGKPVETEVLDQWANAHGLMVSTFHDELRALVRAFGEADPANRMVQFYDSLQGIMVKVLGLAEISVGSWD